MPLPKVSRFVNDGEVDPGVALVAQAIQGTFLSAIEIAKVTGEDREKVAYDIVRTSWFIASRGYGVFSAEFADLEPELQRLTLTHHLPLKTESIKAIPWSSAGVGAYGEDGGWSVLGSVNFPNAFAFWQTFLTAAVIGRPEPLTTMYSCRSGETYGDTCGPVVTTFDFTAAQHLKAIKEFAIVESDYRDQLDVPYKELITEALMFYDPSRRFASEILDRTRYDLGAVMYIARATASGVPLLGRKWIVADLVTEGTPFPKARQAAYDVYNKGGNYLEWRKRFDRFLAVRDILRQIDPEVTDEEAQAIADLPIPLDKVKEAYLGAMKPEVKGGISGGTLMTAAGAGALSAFMFGGPIGLAVGAAVLFLGSRSKA